MAVISIKNKTKSGSLLVGNEAFFPTDFESIATTTVGAGGVGVITFNDIPQTYKHLQVRLMAKENGTGTGGPNVIAALNNDTTGTNYYSHYLYGNGSTASAGAVTASSYYCLVGNITTSNASYANMFGTIIFDILDYTNTNKNKTVRSLFGHDRNGSGEVGIDSALWNNTLSVSSISLYIAGGTNFTQYSSFALYGIKG